MIRKINAGDRELFLQLSDEFYSSPAVLSPIPAEFHENTFAELMRSDEYLDCYILECDGSSAGYALLNITFGHEAGGRVVWLEELYVRSEYRSRGLGSEFFEYLENNIPAARYRLEIEPENERAAKLYRRRGFECLPYSQMCRDIKPVE